MKKNKLFATLLTLIVSAAMCISLAACGETKDDDEKSNADNDGANAAYTVTKEQWEEAFRLSDKNCKGSLYSKDDGDPEFQLLGEFFFTGDGNGWDINGAEPVPGLSEQLNTAYMLNAANAFEHFRFDPATNRYKSTSEWTCYMTSPETPTNLEGEVEFYEGKLVCCIVACNWEWMGGTVGEASARGTYKVEISGYGTAVKPSTAPEE